MQNLTPFPPFDYEVDKLNAGPRWQKWLSRLENLFIGMNLKDDARKRALLLHYAGETVFDIYEAEKGESETSYSATTEVLTSYFTPKKNVQVEIFNFRSCKQKPNQSLDEYVTELRQLSRDCEFTNVDAEILSQVIQHCRSTRFRKRALREPDKTLKEILELGRSLELADQHAATIEDDHDSSVHAMRRNSYRKANSHDKPSVSQRSNPNPAQTSSKVCRNCGGPFPHTNICPAKGKTCNYCKKQNHFKSMCRKLKRKMQVRQISDPPRDDSDSSNDSDDESYELNCNLHTREQVSTIKQSLPHSTLKVNGTNIELLIDTGSTVNILDEATYRKIGSPKLCKSKLSNLFAYAGSQALHVIGQCELLIETKHKLQSYLFYVIKGNHGSLISYTTATELDLVKVHVKNINSPEVKYPNLFKGIGKLNNTTVKLHIDEKVKPVAQKPRRVPFHLRTKVEEEIEKLQSQDIIERIQGEPTPWVSPIVVVPKQNTDEVRICVDMREANKAILRERHQMPTVDELTADLNGATVFSKIDLTSGYHQLELNNESRPITTFSTHIGLFRYKRLNFGISSASEVFQETIRNVIHDIPNSRNISDDIIVYGKTQAEHDEALDAVFNRLNERGLTVNKRKCLFNQQQIEFFGLVFSKDGVSPDPKKVEAIHNASTPKDTTEVKSFLGMTNYCARFIQGYATITEPLRRLTRSEVPFVWTEEQQTAFTTLKEQLRSDTVMSYFNPNEELEIIVDASPVGLGAILTQDGKVLSYASRALTDVESRYSQTEREALAIIWACEHFDMYTNGAHHFTVITDHKPLENIWKKPNPPARIQRWGLRLQPYKLTIKYQPGNTNPSDYLSRHPPNNNNKPNLQQYVAESYVNFIAFNSTPRSMTLDDIKEATSKDKTLTTVMNFVRTSQWYKVKFVEDSDIDLKELKAFYTIRDELTCHNDNILLRNNLIVIPRTLRQQAVDIAHEGHQGITRTKAFIRSKVWFPGINEYVENTIKACIACQAATYNNTSQKEPLQMTNMPYGAWEYLSADFLGPLPSGEYLLTVTDEHSRYPVVEIIRSTSANTVIPALDKILSQFGCPIELKTDNGPPFNSAKFSQYAKYMGFKHRKITPRWPQANGQVETFNTPIMKAIRSAHAEGKQWKQTLYIFLRQYRSTPHTTTKYTPHRLLFGRDPRTKLPELATAKPESATTAQAKLNDELAKAKAKQYADSRNKAKHREFEVGDKVLIKNDKKQNKLSTPYRPEPFFVKEKKGTMITASSKGKDITRNASCFKKLPKHAVKQEVLDNNKQTLIEAPRPERPVRQRRPPVYLKDYVKY